MNADDRALLHRIAYVQDQIVEALKEKGIMLPGTPAFQAQEGEWCPICTTQIHFALRPHLVRICACKPPLQEVVDAVITPR